MPLFIAAALALLVSCRTASPPALSPEPGSPAASTRGLPVPSEAAGPLDPAAAYQACRERVEGPEQEGECKVDADCRVGGCSGEICAASGALDGWMSTCEILPCFQVLQSCGCQAGRCSWTVGAPDPSRRLPAIVLPPREALPSGDGSPSSGGPTP